VERRIICENYLDLLFGSKWRRKKKVLFVYKNTEGVLTRENFSVYLLLFKSM
jgi:hypothetical protein